jgi:AcrR family transcriptional regulator
VGGALVGAGRKRAPASGERLAGRQRRLARILDAAEQLLAAHRFAKATVDEIAAAAGVLALAPSPAF